MLMAIQLCLAQVWGRTKPRAAAHLLIGDDAGDGPTADYSGVRTWRTRCGRKIDVPVECVELVQPYLRPDHVCKTCDAMEQTRS